MIYGNVALEACMNSIDTILTCDQFNEEFDNFLFESNIIYEGTVEDIIDAKSFSSIIHNLITKIVEKIEQLAIKLANVLAKGSIKLIEKRLKKINKKDYKSILQEKLPKDIADDRYWMWYGKLDWIMNGNYLGDIADILSDTYSKLESNLTNEWKGLLDDSIKLLNANDTNIEELYDNFKESLDKYSELENTGVDNIMRSSLKVLQNSMLSRLVGRLVCIYNIDALDSFVAFYKFEDYDKGTVFTRDDIINNSEKIVEAFYRSAQSIAESIKMLKDDMNKIKSEKVNSMRVNNKNKYTKTALRAIYRLYADKLQAVVYFRICATRNAVLPGMDISAEVVRYIANFEGKVYDTMDKILDEL